MIHGCDEDDLKSISTFMKFSASSIRHAMPLLILFAELQFKRHRAAHNSGWDDLLLGLHRIGLQRTEGPEVVVQGHNIQVGKVDYNDMTREMLDLFQKSGFLAQSMVKFQKQLGKVANYVDGMGPSLSHPQPTYLKTHSPRIQQGVAELVDNYDNLIKNCNLTTDGASLLISAVSCLVFWGSLTSS
jgi:hypothetical protein